MTVTAPQAEPPGPYATAAPLYWQAGWRGVLPLPARAKKNPPSGYTGQAGIWPSYPDVHAWTEGREGAGNIALRMPQHVVGLDVDAYDGKAGATTLAKLENAHGQLPPTWRSTSRDDGVSGIRLYRIPENLAWPGDLGGGIEIIQHRHRYTVAWPSIHPDTGGTYRWIDPDGCVVVGAVPAVDDLPDLPDTWVQAITGGLAATDIPRADLDDTAAAAWLNARSTGAPCRAVRAALARHVAALAAGGTGRHDVALRGTQRLAHLAAEGHHGVHTALEALRATFIKALTATPDRATDPAEWRRMLVGAIAIAAAACPEPSDTDPCANPFHGLIDRPPIPSTAGDTRLGQSADTPGGLSTSVTDHGAPADAAGSPAVEDQTRARTSWWPRELDAVLTGADPEPAPTILARDDGQHLFYRRKVNGLIGESESGKTWVALLAVVQELNAGHHVTYVDFEDTAAGIIDRLTAMGVTHDTLRAHFRYIGPDESLDAVAAGDLHEHLADHTPELIVIDGFNAAMAILGLKINDNDDATVFAQRLLKPLAATGAAVVYIDHIPKARDNDTKGGIGAQAKRAMTTGCALRVEVVKPFGRGETGKLRLTVDKDRAGHVRGASTGAKQAGIAVLISLPDGSITVTIEAPDAVKAAAAGQPFRPTHLMEKVSRFLQLIPDGASGRVIRKEVSGNVSAVLAAVERLAAEGYVSCQSGPRGAVIYRSVRPFTELADLTSTPTGSTGSAPVPAPVPEPVASGSESSGSTGSSPVGEPEPLDKPRGCREPAADASSGSGSSQTPSEPWFCRHCGSENQPGRAITNCASCGRRP